MERQGFLTKKQLPIAIVAFAFLVVMFGIGIYFSLTKSIIDGLKFMIIGAIPLAVLFIFVFIDKGGFNKENTKMKDMVLTEGPLFSKLWFFSLPLIASALLQLLYNTADLIVCNAWGSQNSTGAISTTSSLTNLIVNFLVGISVGVNVLMARCYGSGDKKKGQRVVYTALIVALVAGSGFAIVGFSTSKFWLSLMGAGEVLDLASTYQMIYFVGLPFSMVFNFGSAILRATGDSKRPFIFVSLSGVINVVLNLLFVIVFKMDVAGVALATIIAQAISAVCVVVSMVKKNSNPEAFYHFDFKELHFYKEECIEMIKIGFPAGLQGTLFSISNVLMQSSVNSLGIDAMNGNGASVQLEGFIYACLNQVAVACTAFVSANLGAKKPDNIKKIILYSAIAQLIIWYFSTGFVLSMHDPLIRLYVHTDQAVDVATRKLFIIGIAYLLCGFMDLFGYANRGLGHSTAPMVITLTIVVGFRLLFIYLMFPLEQCHNIDWIAISYSISWLLADIALGMLLKVCFKKEKQKLAAETK